MSRSDAWTPRSDCSCPTYFATTGMRDAFTAAVLVRSYSRTSGNVSDDTDSRIEGAIVRQEDEIEDARWFALDALPHIPPRFSIAGHLIRDTVEALAAGRVPGHGEGMATSL